MAIKQSDLQFDDGVPQPIPSDSFVTLVVQSGPSPPAGATSAAITIDGLQVAAMIVPYDRGHTNVQTLSAYVPAGSAGFVTLYGRRPYVATLSSWPAAGPASTSQESGMKFDSRKYQLGETQADVRITATASLLVNIVAANPRAVEGGLQVTIYDAAGVSNSVLLTVPPLTGLSLGAVGVAAEGAVVFSGTALAMFDAILTVETAASATITFSR